MEVNQANIQQLAVYLQQTLSPQAEIRKPAEEFLQSVECNMNYPVLLLSLLSQEGGEANIKVLYLDLLTKPNVAVRSSVEIATFYGLQSVSQKHQLAYFSLNINSI